MIVFPLTSDSDPRATRQRTQGPGHRRGRARGPVPGVQHEILDRPGPALDSAPMARAARGSSSSASAASRATASSRLGRRSPRRSVRATRNPRRSRKNHPRRSPSSRRRTTTSRRQRSTCSPRLRWCSCFSSDSSAGAGRRGWSARCCCSSCSSSRRFCISPTSTRAGCSGRRARPVRRAVRVVLLGGAARFPRGVHTVQRPGATTNVVGRADRAARHRVDAGRHGCPVRPRACGEPHRDLGRDHRACRHRVGRGDVR